jgi:hypothetical protein
MEISLVQPVTIPDTSKGELAQILFDLSGGNMPDIFWDGLLPISQLIFGQPDHEKMIITIMEMLHYLQLSLLVTWFLS